MISSKAKFDQIENVIINTGNILSLNDITNKPSQNPSQELIDAVNITIKDYEAPPEPGQSVTIRRKNDDAVKKISEHDLSELKFGFKLFLTSEVSGQLVDSIEKALTTLKVTSVNNVVIAFCGKKIELSDIKPAWLLLEEYVARGKIHQIGIADIEEETFHKLMEWATVKPSIIQINLSTCCVVPPTLQTFCKDNDIQLLTHSDPSDILPDTQLALIVGKGFTLKWLLRFSVHIKCRGVLTTKGYLLCLGK